MAEYHFYGALCRAASWDIATAGPATHISRLLAAHHRAARNLGAELSGKFRESSLHWWARRSRASKAANSMPMNLYEQAIRSARSNGFVHNEALANELAARFYAARGFEKIANVYLRDARRRLSSDGEPMERCGNSTNSIRS